MNFAERQPHEDYTPDQWAQWHAEETSRQNQAIKEMLEKLEEIEKEKDKLVKQMIEEQNAHAATRVLLYKDSKVAVQVRDEVSDLIDQKVELVARAHVLDLELNVETERAKLGDGDRDTIRQCSDETLEASITTTTKALSRMHRERTERGQRAVSCVVCLDKEKTILLRPCNHLCICESCMGAVQTCPLCRQNIQEKISVMRA